jgi:DNA-binding CsgD family transcriptional regulator
MDAAAAQDPKSGRVKARPGAGETAQRVAEMLTRGMSQDAIAEALDRTKATINWHARRMSVVGTADVGRRHAVCGPRVFSATAASATANCATCVSATSACTIPEARASTFQTRRPRRAYASSR